MGDTTADLPTYAPDAPPELVPPELWSDPHPHYHRMRSESPVKAFPEWDLFVLTRWADCERVLRDPTFSADPDTRRVQPHFLEISEGIRPRSMLMMDPPDHTRLRKLVSKAFTPRTVEKLRPHRIGHGIRAAYNQEALEMLRDTGTVLEICPSSNLSTHAVKDLQELGMRISVQFSFCRTAL